MTRQYLLGELSLILGELQAAAPDDDAAREVGRLRRRAEAGPPGALGSVASGALDVAEAWCWRSLARGDLAAFGRQAAVAAELWDFAVCAGLAEER